MASTTDHMKARLAVAGEVLALMGRHRTSQVELARQIGLSQPALSKRLDGSQEFKFDELMGIAAYFDKEVTALFASVVQGESSSPWITTRIPGQLDLLTAA